MLVPTMTISEIKAEIEKDLYFLYKSAVEGNRKRIMMSRMNIQKFPYITSWQVKSPKSNIVYHICLFAKNKYKLKNPTMLVYTMYSHDWGTTVVQLNPVKDEYNYLFFTPHFFKRYRERMNLPAEMTAQELFLQYRLRNSHFHQAEDLIINNEEKYYQDENIQYYGNIISDGATICEKDLSDPTIIVQNTFISRDMFFKSQKKNTLLHYIMILFADFASEYPRQQSFLEKEFFRMVDEARERGDDEETLYRTVKAYIDNY